MPGPATGEARAARVGMLLLLVPALACGGKAGSADDSAALAASGGIVADSGAVPMRVRDYRLTRERLDGWRGAQRAVARLPGDESFEPLEVSGATDVDVDRAVDYLERRPEMRAAIERSGLSVRDYVLTTLALARARQAMPAAGDSAPALVEPDDRQYVRQYGDDLRIAAEPRRFRVVLLDDDTDDARDAGARDDQRRRAGRDDRSEHDDEGKGHRTRKHGRGRAHDGH
jgi:hypothetical protein